LSKQPLEDREYVVRGLYFDEYDAEQGRVSSRAFGGKDTSVNRREIYPWEKIWYFLRKNQRPPSRILYKGLGITVGKLKQIGLAFTVPGHGGAPKADPRIIEVFPDPYTDKVDGEVNESHAYIEGKLPPTMAIEQIPPACVWHDPP